MGCGPGTMGLIMAKYGASEVDFADLSFDALANSEVNARLLALSNCRILSPGDLFEIVPDGRKYDGIVFNYPFFPANAEEFGSDIHPDLNLRKSMLAGTDLVPRFFAEAPGYLTPQGKVVVAYWHFAGQDNEPVPHAERNGFKVELEERIKPNEGLQIGKDDISIYIFNRER